MEETLLQLQAKDTKERMAGVERLQMLLEQRRKGLSAAEVGNIVDATKGLLIDTNFRVCQGALQALASAAALSGEHLKVHFNTLLPAIVECLGDGKQPVRDAGNRLLLALMEISSPSIVVERAGTYAWTHKNWRVREEFARTMTSAINLFCATEITLQRIILLPVLRLLDDTNGSVRDAAVLCLEEMHRQEGSQFKDELQRHPIHPARLAEIMAKFESLDSKPHSFEGLSRQFGGSEVKSSNTSNSGHTKRSSPRSKPAIVDTASVGGEVDTLEQPVDPIKVYSEKELTREMEKIAGTLTQDQDWSVRMTAMQRFEGLVYGGATEYQCFPALLKQLVGPLSVQLSDRRSSIVKQACHLLNTLSRELLSDFESPAEAFIPMLFKLVVITVQVIAESADNCIKTILRNCRVARLLARIVDIAKNDRNGVLRARCCEYALLVLEQWPDTPEIQRSAELYEDLIKCCVGDAMSEVRSTARSCYRLFAKTWPDRCHKLFSTFDSTIQRLITDEDRGFHKRYSSPSTRRSPNPMRQSTSLPTGVSTKGANGSNTPVHNMVPIVAMDRRASLSTASGTVPSAGFPVGSRQTTEQASERSLESILQASQQRVNAIESMLRGVDLSDKTGMAKVSPSEKVTAAGSSFHGIDMPSARDPPYPASASAPVSAASLVGSFLPASHLAGSDLYNGSKVLSPQNFSAEGHMDILFSGINQDLDDTGLLTNVKRRSSSSVTERFSWGSSNGDVTSSRRSSRGETHSQRGMECYGSVPNFQRPLLRNSGTGRSSIGRNDTSPQSFGEPYNVQKSVPLNDTLTEGLSPNADWSARVAAFTHLKKLLDDPKGLQEIIQSFEKVMKLFFAHLDDPHHKVAQAALSALAQLIPACRKQSEAYLERILPHVFSRLVDPKELIRKLSASVLEIVGTTYTVESLLPALLRSLDEQRSLKARMAVIEFANTAMTKLGPSTDSSGGSGLMKLWLAKICPLANDKNPKLKEIAVNGIISIYSQYDSAAVINFILNLSIDDQSSLRRALKQYTPRIEVDVVAHLQSKHQKGRTTKSFNESDNGAEEGYGGRAHSALVRQSPGSYSSGSINSDTGRRWVLAQNESGHYGSWIGNQATNVDTSSHVLTMQRNGSIADEPLQYSRTREEKDIYEKSMDKYLDQTHRRSSSDVRLDIGSPGSEHLSKVEQPIEAVKLQPNSDIQKKDRTKQPDIDIPNILSLRHQANGDDATSKCDALQDVLLRSRTNDKVCWAQYFHQILTAVFEALEEPDESVREKSLTVILEMLTNQKEKMEEAVEVLLEKLLHASKDHTPRVSAAADSCLTNVLAQFDPYRCLSVVVPLLVSEDVKTLVTCINCLTKLVGRLPQQELMEQLPSFLPALFDAFGNENSDVRKTVVLCLVDIYIALGKAFVPYLSSLSSNQLRLVTIYANRISQARTGTALDLPQV